METNNQTDNKQNTPIPKYPNTSPGKDKTTLYLIILAIALCIVVSLLMLAVESSKPKQKANNISLSQIAPAEVSITSSGFIPSSISIKKNQAVLWINNDSALHQVSSDPYPSNNGLPNLNSPKLNLNSNYSYNFDKVGKFTYHDNLNPYKFQGAVIVKN